MVPPPVPNIREEQVNRSWSRGRGRSTVNILGGRSTVHALAKSSDQQFMVMGVKVRDLLERWVNGS